MDISSWIFVRLYTLGMWAKASSSLLRADSQPMPSVIQTNSNPGTAFILGASSEYERATSFSFEPPPV